MPRTICEKCHKEKIVYRLYVERGKKLPSPYGNPYKTSILIGESCAELALGLGLVFNLRRIKSKDLGTA